MKYQQLLTARWNNTFTLLLGLPATIFVVYALSSGMWTQLSGLIGISIVGVVY